MRPTSLFAFAGLAFATPVLSTAAADEVARAPQVTGDGSVSTEAVIGHGDALFARLDRNGDGIVDQDEFLAFRPPAALGAESLPTADRRGLYARLAGGDGLTQERWHDLVADGVTRADADDDGLITPGEAARQQAQDDPVEAVPVGWLLYAVGESLTGSQSIGETGDVVTNPEPRPAAPVD